MQDTELLKYGKYLTSLISSVILNTQPPEPFEGIDWTKLFKLAKKHDTAVMIFPAIINMEFPEEARALFLNDKNRMVARSTRQTIEAENVMNELERNSIKYIKLKGSHIRKIYPFDYMRTFSDIDLCLSDEDRKKARPIMESLGYTFGGANEYHDEYERDNFYFFELHSHIVPPSASYHAVFEEPFSKSVAVNGSKFCYEFNNEYLYLNLIFHLHKHFVRSGCGIRLFADLLVYENYVKNVDWNFIKSILKEYDLLDFFNTVQKLNEFFFYKKNADKNIKTIAEYIFKNQTSGINNNFVANFSFWGKIKYLLKIWFPPAKELAFRYPVLEKAPVLLPVCWVRRIFYSLFFNRSAFTTQVNNVKKFNSEEFKEIKNARDLATKNK